MPEIYVFLEDEGTDCWRPVKATHVEGGVYLIDQQDYDQEDEKWQFEPGVKVVCQEKDLNGMNNALVAVERAD